MRNDIDPAESQGFRLMLLFGFAGLIVIGLGLAMPTLFTTLFAGAGDPEQAEYVAGLVRWVSLVIGVVLLILGALGGMLWAPFRSLQQTHGTVGSVLMLLPGLLLSVAVFAAVLR